MAEISVEAYKAQSIADCIAPTVKIEIAVPIPHYDELERLAALFAFDAKQIEYALHRSLPGGTYDRLVELMLKRKASHFIVSHNLPEAESQDPT